MKKVLFFLLLGASVPVYCQCVYPNLSYAGYHIEWEDHFDYNPATFKSDSTFNSYWLLPNDTDPCQGTSTCWVKKEQITMPTPGEIRLTENVLPSPILTPQCWQDDKTHKSGWLYSKRYVSVGIIEARIKIPDDVGLSNLQTAFPSFWIPEWRDEWTVKSYTEIDILDNWHGLNDRIISAIYNYPNWDAAGSVRHANFQENSINQNCTLGIPDLSIGYHIYSCLWTPSRVTIYLDTKYVTHIDYEEGRTVPDFQNLLIILQTKSGTVDGLTMDIDWVKYWVQDCKEPDLIIDPNNKHQAFMDYPTLPPNYSKDEQFESLKYRSVILNGSYPMPIKTDNTLATVIEAEATTILPGFIADQSNPNWTNIVIDYDQNGAPIYGQGPVDGYFLAKSIVCTKISNEEDYDNPPVEKRLLSVENYQIASVEIYPNPVDIVLNISGTSEISDYIISDVLGREVKRAAVFNSSINVSTLRPGNYILTLITPDGKRLYRKFIKE